MHNIESPDISDRGIEQALANKPGARVTLRDIEDNIAATYYHVPPDTTLTLCVIRLKNGFNVVGESACVDPAMFNADLGMKLAYENARNKIWPLMGYALLEKQRV